MKNDIKKEEWDPVREFNDVKNCLDKNDYIKAEDLLKIEYPESEWLIENLIPLRCITIISSAPASYKTWLLLDMAVRVSTGDKFLHKFNTYKTKVLIIDEESENPMLQSRLKKISNLTDYPVYFKEKRNFKLNKESVNETIDFCKRNDIEVIAFDSLVRIHDCDENDANKMSKVFGLLRLYKQSGITVILIHHNRKEGTNTNSSQNMRGSSDILASVDCHISIKRKDKRMILEQTKSRVSEEIKPFEIEVNSNEESIDFKYISEITKEDKTRDFKEFIIDVLKENEGLNKSEIFELSKSLEIGGYSTMNNVLIDMEKNNEIISKTGEKNSKTYSLNPVI